MLSINIFQKEHNYQYECNESLQDDPLANSLQNKFQIPFEGSISRNFQVSDTKP